jgi:murein peptide amidase A
MFTRVSSSPYCFRQKNDRSKKLYLSSGIHGNETSGPYTLMRLLEQSDFFRGIDTTVFPILNPYGRDHNQRHNENDVDLNRDYKDQKEIETQNHVKLITFDYDLAICFHEADEADGAYIYKPNANKNFMVLEKILKAMNATMPIDSRHKDLFIEPGIAREVRYKEEHETEAIFLANHGVDAFTIEVPHNLPMYQREATIRAAISEAINILKSPST